MLLDIRKIFASYDEKIVKKHTVDLSAADFPGYRIPQPVSVTLTASLDGNVLELEANLRFTVETECARCLDEIKREFNIDKTYYIREDEWQNDDLDIELNPNGQLDIEKFAYSEIVLEVPPVMLCNEACEGLCPVCGCKKPCSCRHETKEDIDPRLSILKELLN